MSDSAPPLSGPDLTAGIPVEDLPDGHKLLGHANGEPVLIARIGDEVLAIGATCTHYGGPLAEGLVVGDTVRCPLHHACFSLRSGEALRAPALNPVPCYRVERQADRIYVHGKAVLPLVPALARPPGPVVIIGAGAAGHAAAEMLRRQGYSGPVTLLTADDSAPYDRPNLSKDFLAGTAPEEWIPLRPLEFYAAQRISLRLGTRVSAIDVPGQRVHLDGGEILPYAHLLLCTGAEPVRLQVRGADLPHVHYLRTLGDCRALIGALGQPGGPARRAVVVGTSFIGMEVAAALRARGVEVHVVGLDPVPFARTLGPQIGEFLQELHREHGVHFHSPGEVAEIYPERVLLKSGAVLPADLVVVGVGVRPATALAEQAGLKTDRGVVCDEYLETSAPGVYAAGDIARWPDRRSGQDVRVEHWVVAQRQGQVAALNMLGSKRPFDMAPFFWTQHYDVAIAYVGHVERWDRIEVSGSPTARNCTVRYFVGAQVRAVATIGRDLQSLQAELQLEQAGQVTI